MVIKPAFILKYILCNSDLLSILETCDTFFQDSLINKKLKSTAFI